MPSLTLSRRVEGLRPSATLAIAARAAALRREGVPVVNFSLGEPDFDTPEPIKEAAIAALRAGVTKYAPTLGDPETRGVVAEKLRVENGLAGVGPEHVGICVGAKHAFYLVCQCLLDPAGPGESPDEVLIPTPAWVSYAPIAALAGGRVVEVPAAPGSGLRVTAEQVRAAITPRSRLLVINSPCNPTGQVLSSGELAEIAAVVAEAAGSIAPRLLVVSDEIYEKIVYAGAEHASIGAVESVAARTITLNGLSKAFAMTGWRVGYMAMPGEDGARLVRAVERLQGQMTNSITSFVFPAIRGALRHAAPDVERMRLAFARRADLVTQLLAGVSPLRCMPPRGAFYAFPSVAACFGRRSRGGRVIAGASDFAAALLEEERVAVVPGEEFGPPGEQHVRISFACSETEIERGIAGLRRFVDGLG